MEVFMTNLPTQGNFGSKTLRKQLQPFMKSLDIADETFECETPLKRRHGTITFLHEADGNKFLQAHGEIKLPHGRTGSRLTILGAKVLCRMSQRPVNGITLRGLRQQVERPEKSQATDGRNGRSRGSASAAAGLPLFQLQTLQCGYYRYDQGQLKFVAELTEQGDGSVTFGRRYLTVEMDRYAMDTMGVRLIYVPLGTIQEIVWHEHGELTLTLSSVPFFFLETDYMQQSERVRLTALSGHHSEIIGTCLIYRLLVDPAHLHRKMQRLADMGVLTVTRYDVGLQSASFGIAVALRNLHSKLAAAMNTGRLSFPILAQLQALAWNAFLHPDTVAGLTERLAELQATAPVSVQAMKTLFQDIGWPTPNDTKPENYEVPELISFLLGQERDIRSGLMVRQGLKDHKGGNLAYISRAMVTPTRILLYSPELENQNRVLRKYASHHDSFIRVNFADENGDSLRLMGGYRTSYDRIYRRFVDTMINGIAIAGRTFKFLGWSHSSLRAHAMWFVAPFVDDDGRLQTHLTIIKKLGDFSEIRSPARCAARIGQAFSETPFAVPLDEHNISVVEIPDIKTDDGKYVFSDGVGTMSPAVMEAACQHLPASKTRRSCLQVRLGGAKGMLSLDTRLEGAQIRLRPSMIKFSTEETANLEICDVARPMPLYLNRQMIKILEDMGVKASWFRLLQDDALRQLRVIASSAYNMAYFLKHQGVGTSFKLHKLLLLTDSLGLDYRTEPFLRRAAEAVVLRELRLLKHKARLPVPQGITLFGVLDETGFLGPGQVFVTFEEKAAAKAFEAKEGLNNRKRRDQDRQEKPRQFQAPPQTDRNVLVTRSPALHPGDIQWARNRIPPDDHPLRALANCIVFSAQGKRDLPSQLSGGDLDGDIFNVIWDPTVTLQDGIKTYAAAEYARVPPRDIWRPVENEDIANFFVDFIRTDHLGMIATRHLILADQKNSGTLDANCLAMAALHSTAVDFSKTGIPVDLHELRRAHKFRPDFLAPGPVAFVHDRGDIELDKYIVDDQRDANAEALDGPSHRYYRSDKILGVLYRAVDERRIWYDDLHRAAPANKTPALQPVLEWARVQAAGLGCTAWRARTDEATRIRSAYEDSVRSLMHSFSDNPMQPITELEVFTGALISKTGAQNMRQRDRSRRLREEFERIAGWITQQMRPRDRVVPAEAGTELDALELCLACAHSRAVCDDLDELDEEERWGNSRQEPIQSFPLVATVAVLRELDYVRQQQDGLDGILGELSRMGLAT